MADAHRAGHFDQQAHLQRDQIGCAPAEFEHRPEDEAVLSRREDLADVADDAQRVGDWVFREQDALQRIAAHAVAQAINVHGAVEAQQSADTAEREAKPQLKRRHKFGREDEQQREA